MMFRLIVSSILFTFTLSSPTFASPVTWKFTGEVTSVRDDENLIGGQVVIGSPFSLIVTFESTTFDVSFENPNVGGYNNAITFLSGTIAQLPILGPTGFNSITIINNSLLGSEDVLGLSSIIDFAEVLSSLVIDFRDTTGMALTSDQLLINPFDLDAFDSATFSINAGGGKGAPITRIDGMVTTLVPEPSSLLLLSLGAGLILKRKRAIRNANVASPLVGGVGTETRP